METIEERIDKLDENIKRLDNKWIAHETDHFNLRELLEKIHVDYRELENKQRYYGEFDTRISKLEKIVTDTFKEYNIKLNKLTDNYIKINVVYDYVIKKISSEEEELRKIKEEDQKKYRNRFKTIGKIILSYIPLIILLIGAVYSTHRIVNSSLNIGLKINEDQNKKTELILNSFKNDLKDYKEELKIYNKERFDMYEKNIIKNH